MNMLTHYVQLVYKLCLASANTFFMVSHQKKIGGKIAVVERDNMLTSYLKFVFHLYPTSTNSFYVDWVALMLHIFAMSTQRC